MNDWLAWLATALEGAPIAGVAAAGLLGALSVVASPCHLAGVPLVIGVVQAHRAPGSSPLRVALFFGLGVLASFVVVGGLTLAAGRIAGDLGVVGNLLGAALCLALGLQLLEVVDLPWFGSLLGRADAAGHPSVLGFLFGASLGPCTFSFMAPALAVAMALSRAHPVRAAALLLTFAVAHTAVVVGAGVFGALTERYLASRRAGTAVAVFRRGVGVLVILGGLYFLHTTR